MVTTRSKRPLDEEDHHEVASLRKSKKATQKRQKLSSQPILTPEDARLAAVEAELSPVSLEHSDSETSSSDASDAGSIHSDDDDLLTESDEDSMKLSEQEKKIAATMDKRDPYEYICMVRGFHDRETENQLRPKGKRVGFETLRRQHNKEAKEFPVDQPASDRPKHQWVLMRKSRITLTTAINEAMYRCPDAFEMYIYNDWEGYGLLEVIENFIVAFYEAFQKKDKDQNPKDMWIPLVALVHWDFMKQNTISFGFIDDGERVFKTFDLVGKAFLAMLNVLDRAGQLKSNSDFKDLALVISLYLKFFKDNIDDMDDMDGATKCHLQIIKYAQDHKIDLVKNGVAGVKEQLESKKAEVDAQKKWPKEGADRWGFKAAYRKHERMYGTSGVSISYAPGKLGGTHYDITKMSRKMRAQYHFDGKDPLAQFSEKDLREGRICLQ